MHTHITEAQMARALGLHVAAGRPQVSAIPKIRIRLSVRKGYEGTVKEFVREYRTVGQLDAEMRARKEAKQQGFVVWCVAGVDYV